MIEILERYGSAFLWSDGYHFTGVAVTMWLLVISVVSGFFISIPLAIARPELAVRMVDTVQKKATFLQQAAIQLGLNNVVAHHARVEQMTGQYAQISSRAFAELKLFTDLTRHLLAPGGRWLAMKGVSPDDEMAALPADIVVEQIIPLHVPGLDAERHLIILKAGS